MIWSLFRNESISFHDILKEPIKKTNKQNKKQKKTEGQQGQIIGLVREVGQNVDHGNMKDMLVPF